MESFLADLRHAVRMLAKSPGFTLVAVAALALGIGANTAIFTVVDNVLLRPLPYPDPDRIVMPRRQFPSGSQDSSSIPFFNAIRAQTTLLEDVAAYDFSGPGLNLGGGDKPEQIKGIHVSRAYFHLFGASTRLGRAFTPAEDSPGGVKSVVLTDGLWRRRYGASPSILGRPITLSGEQYTVVGVLAPGFEATPRADVFLPLQADPNSVNNANYLRMAARLRPGVSLAQANAQLRVVASQLRKENPKIMDPKETAGALPLAQVVTGDVRPALLILMGAVGFVLLIACANVANLLLARAASRQRELAVRAAIGAPRARIIRQLLTESLLLSSAGAAAGLVLGYWGVRALLAISPGDLPRIGELTNGVPLDGGVLLFTLAMAFLTGILFGLFPALHASRPDLNTTLKETSGRSGTGMKQNRVRGLLVVGETALAVILLIGAALLIRTFAGLRNVNLGIETHHIVTMETSVAGSRYATTAQMAALERQAVQRIESLPGVEAAAPAVVLPVQNVGLDLPFVIPGKPPASGNPFTGDEYWRSIGPHYFDVFRIGLLRGRVFSDSDVQNSQPVAIVNQAFVRKYWPKEDPLGKQIVIGGKLLGPEFEDPARAIAGIVADIHDGQPGDPMRPVMYIPAAQVGDGLTKFANAIIPLVWAVRTHGDPGTLTAAIQREVLAVDSQLPMANVRSMDEVVSSATARENFNMLLLTIFAAIALLLAAIGIYGLMSYSVEQRTNEIGIRMALGASRGGVMKMVAAQGMALSLAGAVVGLVASYGLTRLLEKMLYGVKPTDPATFAIVAAVIAAVSFLACAIPALRATRIDPVIALRYE